MQGIKNLNIEQTVTDCKELKGDKNSIMHFLKKITVKCFTLLTPIIPLTVKDSTFETKILFILSFNILPQFIFEMTVNIVEYSFV